VFIITSANIDSKQGRFWDGRERGLLLEEGLDLAQRVVATYANNNHYFLPAKGSERCCGMGIEDLDKELKHGRFCDGRERGFLLEEGLDLAGPLLDMESMPVKRRWQRGSC
jgi:hypothetical protein